MITHFVGADVDNEQLVRKWQDGILSECRRILGRDLTGVESAFVQCRTGFVALEMIEDHVRGLTGQPDELQRYLRSEEESV